MRIAPYALGNVLGAAAALASLVVLSRLLSPAAYGVYATVLTLATLGQTLGFFWLQTALQRFHPIVERDGRSATLLDALRLGFAAASLAAMALWAAGQWLVRGSGPFADAGWWGLPVLVVRGWLGVVQARNRTTDRLSGYLATEVVHTVGGGALAIAAVLRWPGQPEAALAGLAVAGVLAAAVSPELLRRRPTVATSVARAEPPPAVRALLGEVWRYGAPLSLASLVATALAVSDRLLVASILGAAAAGVYSAGYSLADRAVMLTVSSISPAAKPAVFRQYESGGADAARALLRRVAAMLMAAAFPVVTVLVAAPQLVADVLVGPEMAGPVAEILPWVAVSSLGAGLLTLHFGLAFQLTRRSWSMLAVTAPAAALGLVANVVLLPRFGIIAAAWTTLLAYGVALLLLWLRTRRSFRIPFPASDAARTVAACLPLAVCLRVDVPHTPPGLAALGVGGMLVYVVAAYTLGVLGVRQASWQGPRAAWSRIGLPRDSGAAEG